MATVAAALVTAGTASAFGGERHAVFVQTDGLSGNQVVVYDRAPGGALTQAGSYATGGVGGQLAGSVVDHLASQGSLVLDRGARVLYAVNAGSNSVSVFDVDGDRLALRQVLGSGGTFPVSIAVRGRLVYVLNAENGGALAGFVRFGDRLFPLAGSIRSLGLDPNATPQFVNTPGQVAFSPDGAQLVVTTKANGSDVDVFGVGSSGLLSSAPTINPLPGAVPFAMSFDHEEHLVIAEAGTNSVATFALRGDGTLEQLGVVASTQAATCWITRVGDRFYASNAGSGSLTTVKAGDHGTALTVLGQTATDAGTVDSAASSDGGSLYAQTGAAGVVDEFAIGADGSLSWIGSVTVPGGAGGEGIAAF
jgi:DNA-binding beta-propeller fold protein YncE